MYCMYVMGVRDGYWGGAAKTAEKWLEKCLRMLSASNWKEASYAIGVLSHYFTDPFMPLHTAQSRRETIVHRPLEWSVCCSYRSIFKLACNDASLDSFPIESSIAIPSASLGIPTLLAGVQMPMKRIVAAMDRGSTIG